jgi:putative protease
LPYETPLAQIKEYKMKEQEIGYVSKFFGQISVAVIEITAGKLNIGDTIHIKGYTTDFKTEIESMQVDHETVEGVKKGDSIGVKVPQKVRRKDKVIKLTD